MGNNNAIRINSAIHVRLGQVKCFPISSLIGIYSSSILWWSTLCRYDEMRHDGQPSQIYIYSHDHLRVIKIDKLTRVNKLPATIYTIVFCNERLTSNTANSSSIIFKPPPLQLMTQFNWSCDVKKIHLINPLLSECGSHLHVFTI